MLKFTQLNFSVGVFFFFFTNNLQNIFKIVIILEGMWESSGNLTVKSG